MRITEFKGRPVVDRATARTVGTVGTVVDVFVDATAARIVAVEVASPEGEAGVRIPAEWITRVGSQAVMVARRSGAEPTEVAPAPDDCLNYHSLVGLEVVDESGNRVGNLRDARVDAGRLGISRFEFVRIGWRRLLNIRSEIRPDEIASWSRELMLIRCRRVSSNLHPVA